MEVSSHALAMGRVDGTTYDVARLHQPQRGPPRLPRRPGGLLRRSKATLFTPRGPGSASSTSTTRTAGGWPGSPTVPVVTVSPSGATGRRLAGRGRRARADGQHASALVGPDGRAPSTARTALAGDFNVANAALAVVALVAGGRRPGRRGGRGRGLPGVPGRMERVDDRRRRSARPGRLRAHARRAGAAAGRGARPGRRRRAADRRARLRRRPRPAQAAGDGRRSPCAAPTSRCSPATTRGPRTRWRSSRRSAAAPTRRWPPVRLAGSRSSRTGAAAIRLAVGAGRARRRRGGRRQGPRAGPGGRRRGAPVRRPASCSREALRGGRPRDRR